MVNWIAQAYLTSKAKEWTSAAMQLEQQDEVGVEDRRTIRHLKGGSARAEWIVNGLGPYDPGFPTTGAPTGARRMIRQIIGANTKHIVESRARNEDPALYLRDTGDALNALHDLSPWAARRARKKLAKKGIVVHVPLFNR